MKRKHWRKQAPNDWWPTPHGYVSSAINHQPNAIEIDHGHWFPITKRLTQRCCRCGLKHVFRFRVLKNRDIEMLVEL